MLLAPLALGATLIWQAAAVDPSPRVVAVEERRIPASYIEVAPRRLTPQITGFGTVAPANVWTAVAQVSGPIDEISPSFVRGGFVSKGEVLLRAGTEDAKLSLRSAEAELANAQARLEELKTSRKTTSGALAIERESLELADADLARTVQLAERGVVSESIVQTQHRDLLAQRVKVQSLEATLELLPAQIEAQAQLVETARVAERRAELDLERTVVRVPFDARVAQVDVEISQFVSAGTVMGSLDGIAFAEVDTQISQSEMIGLGRLATEFGVDVDPVSYESTPRQSADLQEVSSRQLEAESRASRLSAEISLETASGTATWSAEVARISDTVDPDTRSIGVIVRVAAPYGDPEPAQPPLIKGMFVRVALKAPTVAGVVLVPRSAIRNGQVMIADAAQRLKWVPVTQLFAFDGLAVLAPEALPPGTRVLTSHPSPAGNGLLLDLQPDTQTEARLAQMGSAL